MWTYKAAPITGNDIYSSLRITLRGTPFRPKAKPIMRWITNTRGAVTRDSVEQMLENCSISVTTFAHFEWLVGDIVAKHHNYHNMVVLARTHIEPVQRPRTYSKSTGSTVYPRGIKIKNIRKVVTSAQDRKVVTTTPRNDKLANATPRNDMVMNGWGTWDQQNSGWLKKSKLITSKQVVTTCSVRENNSSTRSIPKNVKKSRNGNNSTNGGDNTGNIKSGTALL